ncbi:Type IV Pilus-assembly protein W [compost metagenome]
MPETYDSAPTTANWEDLVTIRAWVLARNQEKTTGYTDTNTYQLGDLKVSGKDLEAGFKRQLYSTTVRLNNVAGRREE